MVDVLIGYSACPRTREAFEAAGCNAYTCDLLPARGGPSERHLQCDVWEALASRPWAAAILHPMCTFLTVSAAWALKDPDFARYPEKGGYHQRVKPGTLTGRARREAQAEAIDNFRLLLRLPFPFAIENPAPSFVSTALRPPDQIIQPYWFGDDASKSTGLWLSELPPLRPTRIVPGRLVCCGAVVPEAAGVRGCPNCCGDKRAVRRWANQTDSGQNRLPPSDDRWLQRSETYPGIAAAMGEQWGAWLRARAAA